MTAAASQSRALDSINNTTAFWKGELDEVRLYDRALSAGEAASLAPSNAIDLVVPGDTNPYLAGMPPATTADYDTAGDPLSTGPSRLQSPVQVTGLNLSGNAVLTFSAAGSVSYGGGTPTDPPDGNSIFQRAAENGISGYDANLNALVTSVEAELGENVAIIATP